jgi:hypothetical protein
LQAQHLGHSQHPPNLQARLCVLQIRHKPQANAGQARQFGLGQLAQPALTPHLTRKLLQARNSVRIHSTAYLKICERAFFLIRKTAISSESTRGIFLYGNFF